MAQAKTSGSGAGNFFGGLMSGFGETFLKMKTAEKDAASKQKLKMAEIDANAKIDLVKEAVSAGNPQAVFALMGESPEAHGMAGVAQANADHREKGIADIIQKLSGQPPASTMAPTAASAQPTAQLAPQPSVAPQSPGMGMGQPTSAMPASQPIQETSITPTPGQEQEPSAPATQGRDPLIPQRLVIPSATLPSKGGPSFSFAQEPANLHANRSLMSMVELDNLPIQEALTRLIKAGLSPEPSAIKFHGEKQFTKEMAKQRAFIDAKRPDLPDGNRLLIAAANAGKLVGYEYIPTPVLQGLIDSKQKMTPDLERAVYSQFGTLTPTPIQIQQAYWNDKVAHANHDIDVAAMTEQAKLWAQSAPRSQGIPQMPNRQPPTTGTGKAPGDTQEKFMRENGAVANRMSQDVARAQQTGESPGARPPMGAAAELTYDKERAQRQAEFDSSKRMSVENLEKVVAEIGTYKSIAHISDVFDATKIGPLKGRSGWISEKAGTLGVDETAFRVSLSSATNSLVRLYAGLSQTTSEIARASLVLPNPNQNIEQFIGAYNNLVRETYLKATTKISVYEGEKINVPEPLRQVAKELQEVYRQTNRAQNLLSLPSGSKLEGRDTVSGADVYRTPPTKQFPKGELKSLER